MASPCHHHWKITTANGKYSRGVCKLCGATDTFKNSIAERTWLETRNTMYTGPVANTVFPHLSSKREGEE